MPLETAGKISELNATWPLGSDPKAQGDDHLRLIKDVMQLDVVSKIDGGAFDAAVEVPVGATGLEAINADDVDAKIAAIEVATEFFDPLNEASWRIIGNVLEVWGFISLAGPETIFSFPKTFAEVPAITASALDSRDPALTVMISSISTTQFGARMRDNTGSGAAGTTGMYHAIGEWDGVS